jgi:hypothetical protein
MIAPRITALSKVIQPMQGKYIFLSRSRIPCHNQSNAVIKYAIHENRETPAARRPTHIVKTCGIVITKLKIDALPSNRRINVSDTERADGIAGLGGMFPSILRLLGSGRFSLQMAYSCVISDVACEII